MQRLSPNASVLERPNQGEPAEAETTAETAAPRSQSPPAAASSTAPSPTVPSSEAPPAAGKVASFEEIYRTSFRHVARWARALGGLDADVDDLTQEVFWVVRRKLPAFDGRNLHAWLYRIAQRTVRDYRRRAWFRRVSFGRPDPLPWDNTPAPKESSDPSAQFERQEAEEILAELLSRMSEMRRTVFVLFEIEGYSGKEIAELQGVPLNTVWTRLHHARRDFMRLVELARKEGRIL